MELNRVQRFILIAAAFVTALLALFPPWCIHIGDGLKFTGFYPLFGGLNGAPSGMIYTQMIVILLVEIGIITYVVTLAISTSAVQALLKRRRAAGAPVSCPSCGALLGENADRCRCGYELKSVPPVKETPIRTFEPVIAERVEETPAWVANPGANPQTVVEDKAADSQGKRRRKSHLDSIDHKVLDRVAEFIASGREEQAEQLLQRTFALRKSALGDSHPVIATYLCHFADLERNRGNINEAEDLYQRSLEILNTALDSEDPCVIPPLEGYAMLLRSINRTVAAEAFEELANDIRTAQRHVPLKKRVVKLDIPLPVWLTHIDSDRTLDLIKSSELSRN